MSPFLSIIIPSYNESRNISAGALDAVLQYLESSNYDWELVLSDDGSTDETPEYLDVFAKKNSRIRVLHNIHAGKAPTVTAGMLAARGKWRLFCDFDQSTPLKEVERLLVIAEQGHDVVIGSREMEGARRDKEPFYRHIMGRGFNIIVQTLAVPGILDTQCGFKLFSEAAAKKLFSQLYVYGSKQARKDAYTGAFDVELLFLANKHGFSIKEVPITWKHAQTDRVSPVKDSLRMFRDILAIRLAALRGKYVTQGR